MKNYTVQVNEEGLFEVIDPDTLGIVKTGTKSAIEDWLDFQENQAKK